MEQEVNDSNKTEWNYLFLFYVKIDQIMKIR